MRNRKIAALMVTYARTCMSPLDYKAYVHAMADQILHDATARDQNGTAEAEDFIRACNDFDRAPIQAVFNDGTEKVF